VDLKTGGTPQLGHSSAIEPLIAKKGQLCFYLQLVIKSNGPIANPSMRSSIVGFSRQASTKNKLYSVELHDAREACVTSACPLCHPA